MNRFLIQNWRTPFVELSKVVFWNFNDQDYTNMSISHFVFRNDRFFLFSNIIDSHIWVCVGMFTCTRPKISLFVVYLLVDVILITLSFVLFFICYNFILSRPEYATDFCEIWNKRGYTFNKFLYNIWFIWRKIVHQFYKSTLISLSCLNNS